MKRIRGCREDGLNVTLLGTEKLTRCPLAFIRDYPAEFQRLSHLWAMMQKGFLPEAGGIDDQQAQIMAALQYYDSAVSQVRSEMRTSGKGEQSPSPKRNAGRR